MYCMNCGTQLPDTARFCHSCGAPVDGLSNEAHKPVANSGDTATDRLMGAIQNSIQQAQDGQLQRKDIDAAIQLYLEWNNISTHRLKINEKDNSILQILSFYPLAQEIHIFFSRRWYETQKRGIDKNAIRDDWKTYMEQGLEGLLKAFPKLRAEERRFLVSDLKGLANWIEDEWVIKAILAKRDARMEINAREVDFLTYHQLGFDRMKRIVNHIENFDDHMKRMKS